MKQREKEKMEQWEAKQKPVNKEPQLPSEWVKEYDKKMRLKKKLEIRKKVSKD